ncbi:geranylgeranylglycerol-phosphate geranylgeranyltransferase [candidate division WWE3 bacterium]|uniref:Geranylgeranylglycerol-phosphate geranylgeranyltransferase n=1 Tax=candidate division WWE3 bacterium TaxID=2053526 RepID=A0A955LG22_UNCKA|nr:geranylgeranylglycerol-phosphate geranylgeranyltransferase [candidate division WWE3 bacterium]
MRNVPRGVIRLVRPGTTLSGVLATILGGYVAGANDWWSIVLAALAVLCIQGAGNTVNDVYDRNIDLVNKPWRPIPHGDLSYRQATILAVALFCIGNGISILLDHGLFSISIIVTLTLALYATSLKCTVFVSNLTVAGISALVPLFGATAGGNWKAGIPLAIVVFFGILARELVKDLADIDGDTQGNCQKTAVVLGPKRTRIAFEILAVCTVGAILCPTVSYGFDYALLALIPVTVTIFSMIRVARTTCTKTLEKTSGMMKMAFFVWFLIVLVSA